MKMEKAAPQVQTLPSVVSPAVPTKGMEQAFSCLYFLTKQRIAHTTNYEPLLDLVGYLGIDIKARISKARNTTYTSEKNDSGDGFYYVRSTGEENIGGYEGIESFFFTF